jgi:hypothetical protein
MDSLGFGQVTSGYDTLQLTGSSVGNVTLAGNDWCTLSSGMQAVPSQMGKIG